MKPAAQQRIILGSVGERIRILRREKGWSQEQLAHRCGLHRTYLGGVERGERNISLLNLVKIADSLDVPVHQLFIGHGKSPDRKGVQR